MVNIFNEIEIQKIINRINLLEADTPAKWGKMDVAKMLAHCNVTYEMALETKHKKPKGIKKFLLKLFVKSAVVNEKPYQQNDRTAPAFIIKSEKEFDLEKNRLINYLKRVQSLGESYFEQKESHSFGKLSAQEWNNLFFKHLNHHLNQFGV